jgi:hypothetical protein
MLKNCVNSSYPNQYLKNSVQSVATVMVDVIREFYIAKGIKFDFLIYGESSEHIDDVITEVSKKLSENNVTVVLRQIINIKNWNHQFKKSSIILTKSESNLANLHEHTIIKFHLLNLVQLANIAPEQFKFLVYCEEFEYIGTLQEFMNDFNTVILNNAIDFRFYEFFITNEKDLVILSAFKLYSREHCEELKVKLVNAYDKSSQSWMKKFENHDHYDNFYGCLLKFQSMHLGIIRPKNFVHKNDGQRLKNLVVESINKELKLIMGDDNVEVEGLLIDILKTVSLKTNFSFHCSLTIPNEYKNDSNYLGSKNFIPSAAISLGWGTFTVSNGLDYFSLPNRAIEMYYLVSWNDLYTNYEKLVLPFDFATWLFLSFTFGLTFGVIFGLHQCPQWIRTVVFGRSKHRQLHDHK